MVPLYTQADGFPRANGGCSMHISSVQIVSDSRDRVRSEAGLWGEAES